MALTIGHRSTQLAQLNTNPQDWLEPHEHEGRVRIFRGYFKNTTGGTIATGVNISMVKVPPCRILAMSKFRFSAFGASATIDIGWQNYTEVDGDAVTEDPDGIKNDLDVSSAGSYEFGSDAANYQGISIGGQAEIVIQTGGAVMPTNAEAIMELLCVVD